MSTGNLTRSLTEDIGTTFYIPSSCSLSTLADKGHHVFEYKTAILYGYDETLKETKYAKCKCCGKIYVNNDSRLSRKHYKLKMDLDLKCESYSFEEKDEQPGTVTPNIISDNSHYSNSQKKLSTDGNAEKRKKVYYGFPQEFGCIGTRNHELVKKYKSIVRNNGENGAYREFLVCKCCGKSIITPDMTSDLTDYKWNKHYSLIYGNTDYKFADYKDLPGVHELSINNMITKKTLRNCIRNNHELMTIKATVEVLSPTGGIIRVQFPAMYCPVCKDYFILESEYKQLRKKGVILCKVVDENYWSHVSSGDYYRSPNSLLNMLGYNAQEKSRLTKVQRQKLLRYIIEQKVMTPYQIIDFLEYLIREREYDAKYSLAIEKWRADISYLFDYLTNGYKHSPSVQSITHRTPMYI